MTITPKTFVHKPYEVEAVQITSDNLHSVAEWIGGKLVSPDIGRSFVQLKNSRGYVGDFASKRGNNARIYTRKAFNEGFDPLSDAQHDDGHPALFRSAVSGQFVNEVFAEKNPDTTVSETL